MTHRSRNPQGLGFTLVELMVALTGGLILSVFVFTLTRDVARFFQQQTQLSDATLGVVTGYQRLRADIQRAGFLASPNFAKDLKRCPAPDWTNAVGTSLMTNLDNMYNNFPQVPRMGLARIDVGAAGAALGFDVLGDNGLTPDFLYLYGNYTSLDQYPGHIDLTTNRFHLEAGSEALVQAGYTAGTAAAVLTALFPPGRILRIYDHNTGEEQYSIISGRNVDTVTQPYLQLPATIALASRDSEATCGFRATGGSGLAVNTVNIIRYGLADLSGDANYAFLFQGVDAATTTAGGSFNVQRTELVRQEIDPAAATADLASADAVLSTELVAEFAVDFKVGVIAVTDRTNGTTTYYPEGSGTLANFAGDPVTSGAAPDRGPHLIRALHPRLAVRTRAPDRQGDVTDAPTGFFRIPLTNPGSNPSDYARVRTLQSHIMTRNARNKLWK